MNDVDVPAGYVNAVKLDIPIAAWPIYWIDEMALENGYTISADKDAGVIRAYSLVSEDGNGRYIFIEENLATVCVYYGDKAGAIMALTVAVHDGLLFSSLPIEQLFEC